MKQILQNLKTGATELVSVPAPGASGVGRGQVLIRTSRTLVSAGTERLLVDFGKAGWIEKARRQPEKVRQVLDKIRTDGLLPTMEAVFNRLDEPLPLGYCNAGVVLETGAGIIDLQPGDRVASNGFHAELVIVPRHLCAKIPVGVSDEEAAFTVLGAIALQGIRLAEPTLGERFMVFGLGLVGLLTVQLLRASGCPVLAADISKERLRLAEGYGAETVDLSKGTDPVAAGMAWTGGRGVDGALIAASAKGDDIVHQAAQACRKRGRIILVGVVDLNLQRADFYEKELTFQVSCSYGPGRYDDRYEQGGQDYPIGFVRWTEQRNFEAVLEAMRAGQLRVKDLITHRIPLEEAPGAYDNLLHDPAALGVILEYTPDLHEGTHAPKTPSLDETGESTLQKHPPASTRTTITKDVAATGKTKVTAAMIGAGNFAKMTLGPALVKSGARLKYVSARSNGAAAAHIARKYRFEHAVTDMERIWDDEEVDAAFIVTGHDSHVALVLKALEAKKHVFVEKPLCLNENELADIQAAYQASEKNSFQPLLLVGFNRRFSPHTVKMKELLSAGTGPLTMSMTVNAGAIPPEHWVHDPRRGGGRIIGEACHFIDLLSFLANSAVTSVSARMIGGNEAVREDKMTILLGFADGSIGTVHYFANGSKAYPKETLEVFGNGRVLRMENFRVTTGYGFKGFRSFRTWRQDKGHQAEVAAFVSAVAAGSRSPIPFGEIVNITRASFAAVESAKWGKIITI
ncbi:MAG: bi-domain-containing oxidoreductase [Pseudomonadota bacterium]|nr:bi-domain-containing oxidoreductase [Pseudomonadota bacterium]